MYKHPVLPSYSMAGAQYLSQKPSHILLMFHRFINRMHYVVIVTVNFSLIL